MSLLSEKQMLRVLRTKAQEPETQKDFAESIGISSAYLTDLLKGRRSIGKEVAAKLGYERVVQFRVIDNSRQSSMQDRWAITRSLRDRP